MNDVADFFGYEFETDASLFANEFEATPGIYIVYTEDMCLEVGVTTNLKETIEAHPNTQGWLKTSQKNDVYIAFRFEEDAATRRELFAYLQEKMHPKFASSPY